MKSIKLSYVYSVLAALFVGLCITFLATPVIAGQYAALKGVNGVNTVFDVSQGSPKVANIVFWAVKDVYQNESVRSLPNLPSTVVVFHGPSVKLISSDRKGFTSEEIAELDKFADTILSLIHISEPTRPPVASRMPSSA